MLYKDLGCIHTDMSTSPGSRVQVIAKKSLHVFQWHLLFTFIGVLPEYDLHLYKLFLCGAVYRQPIREST